MWPLSVLHSIVSLDEIYHREASTHPYLKHGPFIYVKSALRDITNVVRMLPLAQLPPTYLFANVTALHLT